MASKPKINQEIEKAISVVGSISAIAARLSTAEDSVSRQAVSKWRKQGRFPNNRAQALAAVYTSLSAARLAGFN